MQVDYKITSIIPLKNQLELKDAHNKIWYYKLPHDKIAQHFKVGQTISLERSETGPAVFLSVKSALDGMKIGDSKVTIASKTMKAEDFAEQLWNNSFWDNIFDEMHFERRFNSEKCFEILKDEAKEKHITLTDVDDWDYDKYFHESYKSMEKGLS